MKTIIRERDSGKAYELLEAANKENGIVVTENKAALQVKANAYGFYQATIIDYDDLMSGNYYLGMPVFIHNIDKFAKWLCLEQYGLIFSGFSATMEEE